MSIWHDKHDWDCPDSMERLELLLFTRFVLVATTRYRLGWDVVLLMLWWAYLSYKPEAPLLQPCVPNFRTTLLEKELLAPVGNKLRYRFFNRCPQSETNRIWLWHQVNHPVPKATFGTGWNSNRYQRQLRPATSVPSHHSPPILH